MSITVDPASAGNDRYNNLIKDFLLNAAQRSSVPACAGSSVNPARAAPAISDIPHTPS
jgi:hypothetical protein